MYKAIALEALMFGLSSLFEIVLLYYFLSAFLGKPRGRRGMPLLIGSCCVILLTAINVLNIRSLNMVTFLLLAMLCSLLFKGNFLIKLMLIALYSGVVVFTETAVALVIFWISNKSPQSSFTVIEMQAGITLSKLLLLLTIMLIAKLFPSKYFKENGVVPIGLWALPLITILSMHFMMSVIRFRLYDSHWVFLVMILLCIALSWSTAQVIYVYNSSMHKKELEVKLLLSQRKANAQEIVARTLERNNLEYRRMAHDYANHLMHLEHLYAAHDQEADRYCKEMLAIFSERGTQDLIDVNNRIVSQSLYRVQNQCKDLGIDFTANITCCNLSFLDFLDASSIFDNLFDNAVTACTTPPQIEHPFITLSLSAKDDFIVIKLENSKSNTIIEKNSLPATTKSNGELHGFGLKNIQDTAAKYGGAMSYSFTQDTFSVIIRLKNTIPTE